MRARSASLELAFVIVAVVLLLPGCAAVGLALLGAGAGVGAGAGTAYTLDGIAYRTFTDSSERVRQATLTALQGMDMTVAADEAMEGGRKVEAAASDRSVYIELQQLTPRTTRMRVTVKKGWFFRDRSTAGEIIAQTEQKLDDMPALSHKSQRQ